MASKHGNRLHVQVLFEPGKAELFLQLTEKLDIKPSVFLRNLAYKYIEENTSKTAFAKAEAIDEAKRQDAINARLEGKAKKAWEALGLDKLTQSDETIDASNSPM